MLLVNEVLHNCLLFNDRYIYICFGSFHVFVYNLYRGDLPRVTSLFFLSLPCTDTRCVPSVDQSYHCCLMLCRWKLTYLSFFLKFVIAVDFAKDYDPASFVTCSKEVATEVEAYCGQGVLIGDL